MASLKTKGSVAATLLCLASPIAVAGQCEVAGPNLLKDADFALEAENPASTHWTQARHAGENVYRTQISGGELTISKLGPQEWFYYGQRVSAKGKKGAKLAFSAELKLDLAPVAGPFSHLSGGGLDIQAIAQSGNVLWSSRRNHEPRIGKTDWVDVQVVFKVPPGTKELNLLLMHEADGIMQVRNPSLRRVDETGGPCPVTAEARAAADSAAETPLR